MTKVPMRAQSNIKKIKTVGGSWNRGKQENRDFLSTKLRQNRKQNTGEHLRLFVNRQAEAK